MTDKIRLTEHTHRATGLTIFVLLVAFATLTLAALAADLCGVRAAWWTDAMLCGAFGALGGLLFIGSRLQ